MSKIDFSEFPWVSSYEFNWVRFDLTDFGDGYQATIVYSKPDPDREGYRHGVIWEVPMVGETIGELKARLDCLVASGIFGNVTVDGHGTLYNDSGDEVAEICWTSGRKIVEDGHYDDDEDEEDEDVTPTVTVSQSQLTLH